MNMALTRDGMIQALTPPLSLNVSPLVVDFCNQSDARHQALRRAASRLADAAVTGQSFANMVSTADFAVLKAFVAYADGEFALAGVCRRDSAVDQQYSPNETDPRDRVRL